MRINKVLLRSVVVIAGMVVTLLSAVNPASAALSDVQVTNLSRDQKVPYDWPGPIRFDFSNAAAGQYNLGVKCGTTTLKSTAYRHRPGAPEFAMRVPRLTPGTCHVIIANGSQTRTMRFQVMPPPLKVSEVGRFVAIFYPYVKDGYRDEVDFDYRLSHRADVSLVVLNSANKVVRSASVAGIPGMNYWTWDGLSNWNSMAPVGDYRLRVTASTSGVTSTAYSAPVTVRRGYLTTRHGQAKSGENGWPSTKGSCYITRDSYFHSGDLDCWGGTYARMTYTFAVPSNATNFRYAVSGEFNGADICCRGGLSTPAKRVSPTRYRVTVQINGWRAYSVYRVGISYDTRRAARVTG